MHAFYNPIEERLEGPLEIDRQLTTRKQQNASSSIREITVIIQMEKFFMSYVACIVSEQT